MFKAKGKGKGKGFKGKKRAKGAKFKGKGKGKGRAAPPKVNPNACEKCGEDTGGAKFCPVCGELQKNAATAALSPSTQVNSSSHDVDEAKLRERFARECEKDGEEQSSLFLKSFIFQLGDDWKTINKLLGDFRKMLRDEGESDHDANEIQAANFLQHNGFERTAIQRREEVRDIDMDDNSRICFLEYLCLHFKSMILAEYYKRKGMEPEVDLSNGARGVTGVGPLILDELFHMPEGGLPAALVKAIDEFTAKQRARNNRFKELEKASQGQSVKAMAARNEIEQMNAADVTEMNRLEITLNAAKRKALKTDTAEAALVKKQQAEKLKEQEKRRQSRNSLKSKASLWEGNE